MADAPEYRPETEPQPGEGIDAQGNRADDPTRNVFGWIAAVERRQDDLRAASDKRSDDLRAADQKLTSCKYAHLKEMAELRASHARELNEAETKRIDAIRSVDVAAVGTAAERAMQQASVLATQVTQSAETLRALVSTTAAAQAATAAGSVTQLSDRITLLERGSYEGVGKSAVADPQLARMVQSLEALQRNMAQGQGQTAQRVDNRSNIGMYISLVGGATGFVLFVIAIVLFVVQMTGNGAS